MRSEAILYAESPDEYNAILRAALDMAEQPGDVKLVDGYGLQVPLALAEKVQQYQQVSESSAPKKSTKKKESAE